MTPLHTLLDDEQKAFEENFGEELIDARGGDESLNNELKSLLALHDQKIITAAKEEEREKIITAVIGMCEGIKGCRFGCFCGLCALCDEDTHIHCGECVMGKPISALSTLQQALKKV